jgi:predicted nuclease of restriction endonuclease-like (RecB) superfamily
MTRKRKSPTSMPGGPPVAAPAPPSAEEIEGGRIEAALRRIREVLGDGPGRSGPGRWADAISADDCWRIGQILVEAERFTGPRSRERRRLIDGLSARLRAEFGPSFNRTNLYRMRAFVLAYPRREALRPELTWTHYAHLREIADPEARAFFEAEAVQSRWTTIELRRQIRSRLFDRLALRRDAEGVRALARVGHAIAQPADLVKDPLILEFTGLAPGPKVSEAMLEDALIAELQGFLLELGRGFAFVGRQQRIAFDGNQFFVDLVFYNRITRSIVLVDLKVEKLTHQDLGQMQMYVNYYRREMMMPGEGPPIGIVLCSDKSDAEVRYTLPEGEPRVFAARYRLALPTEEELADALKRARIRVDQLVAASSLASAADPGIAAVAAATAGPRRKRGSSPRKGHGDAPPRRDR